MLYPRKEPYIFASGRPGRTTCILAGIHGNEICGVKAFQKIDRIQVVAGKVIFMFGNLRAIKISKRQIDVNLNRMFRPEIMLTDEDRKTYEYHRSGEIMQYLNQADALLDIHSSANPQSTPFLICEPSNFGVAAKLPFPIRSDGWHTIEPGGTDFYMNNQRKIGICAECGSHDEPAAIQRAEEAMMTFLRLMGNIKNGVRSKTYSQRQILAKDIYKTNTSSFKLVRPFADFEPVSEGTLIAHDGKALVRAPYDCCIIFAKNRDRAGAEAFIMGVES